MDNSTVVTIEIPDNSWLCPGCKNYATIDQVCDFDFITEDVTIYCDRCEELIKFDNQGKGEKAQ